MPSADADTRVQAHSSRTVAVRSAFQGIRKLQCIRLSTSGEELARELQHLNSRSYFLKERIRSHLERGVMPSFSQRRWLCGLQDFPSADLLHCQDPRCDIRLGTSNLCGREKKRQYGILNLIPGSSVQASIYCGLTRMTHFQDEQMKGENTIRNQGRRIASREAFFCEERRTCTPYEQLPPIPGG